MDQFIIIITDHDEIRWNWTRIVKIIMNQSEKKTPGLIEPVVTRFPIENDDLSCTRKTLDLLLNNNNENAEKSTDVLANGTRKIIFTAYRA